VSGHDHDHDTVRGLPGPLPSGESILWQGSPRWEGIARRVFHIRKLAIYFGAILVCRELYFMSTASSASSLAISGLWLIGVAAAALGLLSLIAWLIGRTTIYTITNRRIVLQIGMALPMNINIPFRLVESAGLHSHPDGTGDIQLSLAAGERIAYLALWPHARPWRLAHAEPLLRCVPEAAAVAQVLARALAAASAVPVRAAPEAASGAEARRRATAYA